MKTIKPTLSIITRSCCRPVEFERCINSVLCQTDPDFEQIVIPDEIVHGLYWANRQIKEHAYKLHGQFVYILDDDDYISNPNFIKDFKQYMSKNSVINLDILVICRGTLNGHPVPAFWEKKITADSRKKIAAPNLISSRQLFDKCADAWDQPRGGDFSFLMKALTYCPHIFWWDYEVFCAESSCGLTAKEKERFGFYG